MEKKSNKVSFEELQDLLKEYDRNIPKIGRFYLQARETWKDVKPKLMELRKDPSANVNPHPAIKWFIDYRDSARKLRKKNQEIKKKIMKVLSAYNKSLSKEVKTKKK